ncbi:MAG: hypothetical protein ACLVDP_02435 [Flavonifractor plautii]
MKFTICHDTSKKTLAIPRAVLQLSGLEDAERLALHAGHGCVVLTRQEGTARERLEAIRPPPRSERRHGCPPGPGQPGGQRHAVQKSVRGIPNL